MILFDLYQAFFNLIKTNPYKLSAELYTLRKFVDKVEGDIEDFRVALFSTDTGLGFFSTNLIADYLQNFGLGNVKVKVDAIARIEGFGKGSKYIDKALSNLASTFTKKIVEANTTKGITIRDDRGNIFLVKDLRRDLEEIRNSL